MDRLHVFIDEYGDANLDVSKEGVSSAYIIAALCVRQKDIEEVAANSELVRKKYFQSGEMKSSSIGVNATRRQHIIRDLSKSSVFVIAFCALKDHAEKNSGLAYKKSFIKFFASQLYERVARCADEIYFFADAHGTPEFHEEMHRYLEGKLSKSDLFSSPPSFKFLDSKESVLLQAADVFAGSLARVHDVKKYFDDGGVLGKVLGDSVSLTLWPRGRVVGVVSEDEHLNEDDERVRRYCFRRAEEHLKQLRPSPEEKDDVAKAVFLDALLTHHVLGESGEYLSTRTLKREISSQLGEPISDHRFRSAVVAKLRDADVIISSCSRGYRLPSCVADVVEFASFANSQILPMVGRVRRARKGIREATLGSVDMLAGSGLEQLKVVAEAMVEE